MAAIARRPEVAFVHANHAEVDEKGTSLLALHAKPEPSWVDLVHLNYIDRFWLVRRELFDAFDPAARGAHEHDFLLRLTEATRDLEAVPAYLYYRRRGGRR